jgi:hypothetical protein
LLFDFTDFVKFKVGFDGVFKLRNFSSSRLDDDDDDGDDGDDGDNDDDDDDGSAKLLVFTKESTFIM